MCQTRRRYSVLTGKGVSRLYILSRIYTYYPTGGKDTEYPLLSRHFKEIRDITKAVKTSKGFSFYHSTLGVPYSPIAVKFIKKAIKVHDMCSFNASIKKAIKAEKRHLIRLGVFKVAKPHWQTSQPKE